MESGECVICGTAATTNFNWTHIGLGGQSRGVLCPLCAFVLGNLGSIRELVPEGSQPQEEAT